MRANVLKNGGYWLMYVQITGMIFILSACNRNPHKVDVSDIKLDVRIERFDQKQATVNDFDGYKDLKKEFFYFSDIYFDRIIGDITGRGLPEEERFRNYLDFIVNDDVKDLFAEVQKQHQDLSSFEQELNESLRYFRYHFPKANIPHFVSFIAPFRVANPYSDAFVGIGLDMYLGAEFEPYSMPPMDFPQYLVKKFDPKYMLCNTMRSLAENVFPPTANKNRLIDEMIYEGKMLYFLDATCPDEPDSLKIGYFQGQIEWNEKNAFQIWDHLIQSNMLYSSDRNYYIRYLNDGPFTIAKGVPQDASPRIAAWVGWQIVRAYMKRNSEVSLEALMSNLDADLILKESGYRP